MQRALAISNIARLGLALAASLMASLAAAGPINFASQQVNIRAGVVIAEANQYAGVTANDAPFVWYNISTNPLVKPAGWNFYNPHAPGQMTAAMNARWTLITAANGGTSPIGVGLPLTKAMAGYWEVPITSIGDSAVSDYDVLYLPAYENLSLNASERSRLRRFVDQGGVLWIDVADSTNLDVANSAPLSFNSQFVGINNPTIVDPTSQIFSFPNALTWLPDATPRNTLIPVNLAAAGFSNIIGELASVGFEFGDYEVDGTSAGQATVVAGRLGSGQIVVTSRGVGSILNRAVNGPSFNANVGFVSLSGQPDASASQVGLFAINIINLLNGSTQANQGSRKTNSIATDNRGPLIQEWHDETQGGPAPTAQPIEYKGMTIVAGQNRVYAYNAVPGSDLDQDGNPDDGVQDYGYGRARDLIWQSVPLNGPLSAPCALAVPNGSGGIIDEIAVVDGNGNLVTLNAFPLNGNGTFNIADNPILKSYSPPNGSSITSATTAPFGPTVHDGLIYVTDNVQTLIGGTSARVWVVEPEIANYAGTGNGGGAFAVGGSATAVLQQASQGVTIGYIPIQDNSGGADCVAYLPTAPQAAGIGGASCGVTSIWVATKGEQHPVAYDAATGTMLAINPRAGANGRPIYTSGGNSDPLGLHVTLIDINGNALTVAQMNTIFSGPPTLNGNELDFPLTGTGKGLITSLQVTTVSIDYHLDWDNTNVQVGQVVRGSVQLPDDANRTKVILGNLALSPAGTLYAVEADPANSGSGGTNTGGMFFALREQGQGAFNVVARFDLYDGFNMVVPSSNESNLQGTPISSVFEDNDPTQTIPGASAFISGAFTAMTFESGPSVMDGRVFVKARGYKKASLGFYVPCMVLLCFAGEPNPPTFTVPVLHGNFVLLQPDVNKSIDKTQPDVFNTLTSNQVTYSGGVDHATISLNSLSSTNRGQLNQTLSESLPVVIQQPGQPNFTVDPSLNGTWSPLQWYTVFYGLDPGTFAGSSLPETFDTGAPVITGNTVYAASNSFTPYVFQGISPVGKTPTGMIVGYNAAATGASDPFAVPNVTRPYFTQLTQLKSVPTFASNPDLEWPLNATATSFTEYLQRMYQTVLDGANLTNPPICFGLAAGKDCLFAYSNLGVYGYKKSDIVVADEDRLATFDPSGEAQWSTNQTLYSNALASATAQAADSHPLVRPTRAYEIDANDYVVVDPGSNRIAWIDKAGHEIQTIEGFNVDTSFQPDGYAAGEQQTFSSPQDMLTFTNYVLSANNPFTDNAAPLELWRHYLIADTGNHRFLELVDRYAVDVATRQPSGAIAKNVLYYHSPAAYSGKGYDYNGIARIAVQTANPANPQFIYAASIGSTEPSRVGAGLDVPVQQTIPNAGSNPFQLNDSRDGNGGVVVLSPGGTQVINQVAVPAIAAGVLYDPTTGTFNAQAIPAQYIKLGAVSSVTMSYYFPDSQPVGGQQLRIMVTTNSGVYEIAYTNNPVTGVNNTPQDWVVQWMMPNSVYTNLRRDPFTNLPNQNTILNPAQFHATFARRTNAGTVLITNNYVGSYQDGAATPFQGEILEVDGNTLGPGLNRGFSFASPFFGFDALSIWYSLPSVSGARGIIAPIFADRR
jgi:hypothetical protein